MYDSKLYTFYATRLGFVLLFNSPQPTPLTIVVRPPGGGGHSTSQLDRGVPLGGGGVKTWPCHIALGARKIHPVIIYLTKNIQMHTLLQYCTPRIYPVWLGMLSWQAKKKKKKKKRSSPPPGSRACHKTLWARDPVINEGRFWYPVSMVMTTLGRLIPCANGDDHIRPIWYPVPILMTGKIIPCPAASPYHLP